MSVDPSRRPFALTSGARRPLRTRTAVSIVVGAALVGATLPAVSHGPRADAAAASGYDASPGGDDPAVRVDHDGYEGLTAGTVGEVTATLSTATRGVLDLDRGLGLRGRLIRNNEPATGGTVTLREASGESVLQRDADGAFWLPPLDRSAPTLATAPELTSTEGLTTRLGLDLDAGDYTMSFDVHDLSPTVQRRSGTGRVDTAAAASSATFTAGTAEVFVATADDFPDALAGGPSAARLGGPILLVGRDSVPAPTLTEIDRLEPSRITILGGPGVISEAVAAELAGHADSVRRLSGPNRYATAATVATAGVLPGVPVVFIATGERFPDAIGAGAVAALSNGPILLAERDRLPDETVQALDLLVPGDIVVVGGPGAISEDVLRELEEHTSGAVTRVGGSDRYATNVALNRAAFGSGVDTVVVATGEAFPDVLGAVPTAGVRGLPVLLTPTNSLHPAVAEEIARLAPRRVVLLGGTRAVSEDVATSIAALLPERASAERRPYGPTWSIDFTVADGDPDPDPSPSATPSATPSPTPSPSASPSPAPAVLAITAPTTDAPGSTRNSVPVTVRFSLPAGGGVALFSRPTGTTPFTLMEGHASGTEATAGSYAYTVVAPARGGTYDLRLTYTDSDNNQSQVTELASLVVTQSEPVVKITAPTGTSPVITGPGDPVRVTFTSDTAGPFHITYKANGAPATAYADFPGGTRSAVVGSNAVTVNAPAVRGPYDLQVAVTGTDGQVGADQQFSAINVTDLTVAEGARCDVIDPSNCLFPFPNDHFTAASTTTDTGLRIDFDIRSMPKNSAGKPVDPTEWNRNDGFSPGAAALTFVPGLDLDKTWGSTVPHLADLARYTDANAPMVVIDTTTGQRHPFWSELDTHIQTGAGERTLILRPSTNWEHGRRYIVALRNLKDAGDAVIAPGAAFKAYRDALPNPSPTDLTFDARRPGFETMFAELAAAGIPRNDLYLAWDFTVASARNGTERVLHMRDEAFATDLGDVVADGLIDAGSTSPEWDITEVRQQGTGDDTRTRVYGTIPVPNYLDRPQRNTAEATEPLVGPVAMVPGIGPPISGGLDDASGLGQAPPGSRLRYGADGLPEPSGTVDLDFVCHVPKTVYEGGGLAHPTLYGHGLLGSNSESGGGSTERMREAGFMICGTPWIGMATEDLANVVMILGDISNFPSLADRSQQGFLNFLFLGRALKHPDGLATDTAFAKVDGTGPVFQTGELFYDGNSQGGIMGGSLAAISQDFTRAVLGVPGGNYSTLLNRSVDWEPKGDGDPDPTDPESAVPPYSDPYYAAYQGGPVRQLGFQLMQMLWDRSESNGYAHFLTTDPLPGTPPHQILMHPAYSDYQVTNVAAEVQARTAGMRRLSTDLAPGRHWAVDDMFGFEDLGTDATSALIYYDSGNPIAPLANRPPGYFDQDPHSDPRKDPFGIQQKKTFYLTGIVEDVHNGAPYWAIPFCPRHKPPAFDPVPLVTC